MTYTKPKDVSYVDMCIYIDNNVYNPEGFDEEKVYEYLYHIEHMLARTGRIFNDYKYYGDFAIYSANKLYFRLTNPKQFEFDENNNPKMDKVKSILNFAKSTLHHFRIDFQQSEYCQCISKDAYIDEISYDFNNLLQSELDDLNCCEFGLTFSNIDKTCKQFLNTIPVKRDSSEWLNIYVSVMLTFLNTVTLNNIQKRRIKHLTNTGRLRDEHIYNAYESARNSKAILFHLDESMNDYILVLSRQLRHLIAKDLTDILHTNISNDMVLNEQCVRDFIIEEVYED